MSRRVPIVAGVSIIVALFAAYVVAPETDLAAGHGSPRSEAEMADSIGAAIMGAVKRGHVAGRSAEVFTVPKPHRYLAGDWDLTTLWTNEPWLNTAHPNPWRYIARVPLIFYGPGYVPNAREVYDPVDLASIAPTYAELLQVKGLDAEAEPLAQLSENAGPTPPRVIFNVVIDGAGWNALQAHPDSWPAIGSMAEKGTTYYNATIGSAPAITGAIHATIGTGVYPATHGLPGNQMRAPDGSNTDTWRSDADGRYLRSPTVSELWDEQEGNRPIVGTISYEGWHLGMIGRGSQRPAADKDVAALWNALENEWWINEDYYELPAKLRETDLATLESYEQQLDPRDGVEDGVWFGHALRELQGELPRPATPAFVRFTGDAVIDTMRESELGQDRVTDLFWIEMKMPDYAGHRWNMDAPEQSDVLRETDAQVARFKAELDRTVGSGNYILMITADHGQQPLPDTRGGWRINTQELEDDVEDEFGDVVEKVTTTDIFVDRKKISQAGMADVAEWLGGYTIGENIPEARPGTDLVPRGRLNETLFAGAFSTRYLQDLTDDDIKSFGDSDFEEGSYTIDRADG